MTGAAQGAAVQLDAVEFSHGQFAMRLDLRLEASSITALMGPSGSGKSTLLNLVSGFETPKRGRIVIGGDDVTHRPPAERPVSMVFQENNLFGHLTVEANVGLGRSPALRLDGRDRQAVADALAATGLSGKEKRRPRELSGGERQRVALARVLVRDRPVLLLDEPFASLDPALHLEMIALLRDLHGDRGMTVLMVTHHMEDAKRLAQNTILLEEGRVVAAAPTGDIFSDLPSEALKRYLGADFAPSGKIARKPT